MIKIIPQIFAMYLVPAAYHEVPYVVSYIFLFNPQTNQW